MRFVFLFGALAALASAVPHPQDDSLEPTESETSSLIFPTPTVPLPLTTSLNIPVTSSLELPFPGATTSSRRRPHWEPIPIFTKECKCNIATARYPCWATDALQKCNYEEVFSYGCYMEAAGGCPTPTRACKDLYQPTPRTGRHPCDLGGNPPPLITSVPVGIPVTPTLNVSIPAFPTGNVSLPVMPTANITLPVLPTANTMLPVLPTANVSLPVTLTA